MMEKEYRSKKSHSTFVARGEKDRAFLVANGEAATIGKVRKSSASASEAARSGKSTRPRGSSRQPTRRIKMGDNVKFEKVRADDGVHDGIEANGSERPANICALAIIAASVAFFVVGVALLFAGVLG